MADPTRVGSLSGDTTASPSGQLWQLSPHFGTIRNDPNQGFGFEDDFSQFIPIPAGADARVRQYRGFADTGGTVAATAVNDVGITAVFSSDGDNEGASLELESKPFKISKNRGKFWFECRVKTSTIADTKHGIFIGLIEAVTLSNAVPIQQDGTIVDANLVGFHRLEGDGDQWDTIYKADSVTSVDVAANAKTIVADTYQKLGMYFDGFQTYSWWVDGVKLADTKTIPDNTGTDFPADVFMSPVIGVLNATGSTPGDTTVDWWRAIQLRS